MLRLFLLSFAVALALGYVILRYEHLHRRFTGDIALRGSHKVHTNSVSRVGGVSIFLGWLAGLIASAYFSGKVPAPDALLWAVCLLPAFGAGLTEDFTKRVSPVVRLVAAFVSAGLGYVALGAAVSRVDIYAIDVLLGVSTVSFLFTLLAVGGVAHSINIIDGLNGLASGVCLVALLAIGYVAFHLADWELVLLCGLGTGAILGFRIWNYPSGRLFCGDGGAYFLGAYVGILSALLVHRHREASAWFPFLLVLYPVWETLFSAYRRRVLRGRPASAADKLHMHTLFYKRVKRASDTRSGHNRRNSDASVSMMLFAGGSALPAVLWWSDGGLLLAAAFAYIAIYLATYRRLVRFGSQRKRRSAGGEDYVRSRIAAFRRNSESRRTVRQANKIR